MEDRVYVEEYVDHLNDAHIAAQKAYNLLYERGGPKRNFWVRWILGHAQSLLIGLYIDELKRKDTVVSPHQES